MDNPVLQLLAMPDMRRTSFTDCRTGFCFLMHGLQLPRTTGSPRATKIRGRPISEHCWREKRTKKQVIIMIHWMHLRVTGSSCILQLSAGAWTSLRTFPYLFLRLCLVFISVCSSSPTRPVYRMYVTPGFPILTINLFAASISYVLQKSICFCHVLIKKDLSRGYHPKTAIENKKLAKTSEGFRSFFCTLLQSYISIFPPLPRRLA